MTLTIQAMIDAIIQAIPDAPFPETVDTVKGGDPTREITGVVTTFLATHAVLQKAIELGANFVIAHEPVFYNHLDQTDWLEDHPVYQAKRKLIEDNGLVVWRFHDYWHSHRPDGIMTGMLRALEWEAMTEAESPFIVRVPAMTLTDLVSHIKQKLGVKAVRVIGAPDTPCSTIGFLPGTPPSEWQMNVLKDVDVLIAGEIREWETSEYTRDAISQGMNKALLVIGHEISEEAGMAYLVEWLNSRFPGLTITHVPSGEPFRVE